jgi:hypothetical protein
MLMCTICIQFVFANELPGTHKVIITGDCGGGGGGANPWRLGGALILIVTEG